LNLPRLNAVPTVHKRNLPSKDLSRPVAATVQRQVYGPVRPDLIKRGIDILAALVAIIFVSPLLLVCALCTWADCGVWPVARRVRIGQYGRLFSLLTFRTEQDTAVSEELPDTRPDRSPVGQLLAISNLDRLPELFNLLRGDLSLVGPRPLSKDSDQYYAARIPGYIHRSQVKPGLFGWAQLHEQGYPMDIRRQIQLDIWYAQNASLKLDFRILRLSLQQVISGQG
jgi:lipopolysaccharide/colanic/teichoic acid biosynthesis glycosyltransferase